MTLLSKLCGSNGVRTSVYIRQVCVHRAGKIHLPLVMTRRSFGRTSKKFKFHNVFCLHLPSLLYAR